ncbi:malonyl-coenzyme A:anthocyanin 3-O-glucoside-6''-O-malonyltransferase-like [Hibiscus syriacus]|uniref:malonyl-coenzyme A:anthocyanin 3-O-glucoside-6''-O-malonyltransferase-like n=1 Tax=Hibiscus syriacus TaxID=106335 RepID=UPI0019251380|nr:malonyl-coenzyme A:anthocyanin 3-O-glucoside-6''-O-malonyltransferase-like [Hibiscus syriacus]
MADKIVIEDSMVFPSHGSLLKPWTLPLTFLDITWLGFHPMQRLLFYDFPYDSSHFIQIVLPNLKSSLSLALQHFFPLAGNFVFPPPPLLAYIRFEDGDSVRFIEKETIADFRHLIGDHEQHVEEFQAIVTDLRRYDVSRLICEKLYFVKKCFGIAIDLLDLRTVLVWMARHGGCNRYAAVTGHVKNGDYSCPSLLVVVEQEWSKD